MNDKYKIQMSKNISKYFTFKFFDMFALFLPYIVFYYQTLGFSLGQIAILQSVMAITLFIVEIPSGYITDRFGRKNSMIISVIFQISSLSILYLSNLFFMFIIAHVLLGLSRAFLSGSDSAFLYDSLINIKREKEYKKIEGRAHFFGEIGVILASLLAILVIEFGLKETILVTIFVQLIVFLVVISFVEPKIMNKIAEYESIRKEFKSIGNIIKKSFNNKKLMFIFTYSFIIFGISNTIFVMSQPYFKATGLDLKMYGVAFALFSVIAGISSFYAHKIEHKLGVKGSLLMMPILLVLALMGSSIFFLWFGFIFILFREFVRGYSFPVIGDYTNIIAKSEERATVLSIGSMFSRLGLVFISTSIGFFSDNFGLQIVFFVTALILLGFIIILPVFLKNNHKSTL